jgi:nitroreductase
VPLPAPRLSRPAPLMQALKDRCSERNYSDRKLSTEQLGDILWAANGVNREDGKHTSPSAMNRQGVDIYAVTADGAFLYDPIKHALTQVAKGDFRKEMGTQEFVPVAALNLAFVVDTEVIGVDWASWAIGCMMQNVALYCATEGLGNVVRGWFEPEKVARVLDLKPHQKVAMTQTVGYPK